MASRSDPSLSKVQFLLHLLELHHWAAQACRGNMNVLRPLFQSPIPLPAIQCVYSRLNLSQRYLDDIEYLAGELELHAAQISNLKATISDQIDLFDKRRNRIVGMLIAIYVPLAFATV